jgi:hypothetical protein
MSEIIVLHCSLQTLTFSNELRHFSNFIRRSHYNFILQRIAPRNSNVSQSLAALEPGDDLSSKEIKVLLGIHFQ